MEKNEHNINEILREKAGEERTETILENESLTVFENDKVFNKTVHEYTVLATVFEDDIVSNKTVYDNTAYSRETVCNGYNCTSLYTGSLGR